MTFQFFFLSINIHETFHFLILLLVKSDFNFYQVKPSVTQIPATSQLISQYSTLQKNKKGLQVQILDFNVTY